MSSKQGVRLVFTLIDDHVLYFHMMGTHDQVRKFLRFLPLAVVMLYVNHV